jgi:hypothetical protein
MFKKNKNLLLFLILIGALGITYWFEERGNLQTGKIEAKKVEILSTENLGELKAVKGIKIDLSLWAKN